VLDRSGRSVSDHRDLRPRGPDRRRETRRETERTLHYATVNLCAAAIAAADQIVLEGLDLLPAGHPFAVLVRAAEGYGHADAERQAAT
jgi:hypothetical protein